MMERFALLAATSVVLTVIAVFTSRRYGDDQPANISIPLFLIATALFSVQTIPIVVSSNPQGVADALPGIMILCIALTVAFPPMAILGYHVSGSLSDIFVRATFDSSIISPQPSDFSKARAKAKEGNINGALREYRRYFDDNPKTPAPLFAAAQFLEHEGRFDQAVSVYEEIAGLFKRNRIVWAEASLRLASVHENNLDDPKEADNVLRKVLFRARTLEQGRIASQRLLARGGQKTPMPV